jgi:hypothetical protein
MLTGSYIKNPTAFNLIVGLIISIVIELIKFEMKHEVFREVATTTTSDLMIKRQVRLKVYLRQADSK